MKNRIGSGWLHTFFALALLGPGAVSALEQDGTLTAGHGGINLEDWHGESLANAFDLPPGVVGVWSRGSGAILAPSLGVLSGAVSGLIADRFGQGQRLKDFESYLVQGVRYYALVFEAGTGAQELRQDLPSDCEKHPGNCFSNVLASYKTQGLFVADFETRIEGGQRVWSALFRPGNGNQEFYPEVDARTLAGLIGRTARRLQLSDFERLEPLEGIPRFAAIFREGTGSQKFFAAQDPEDFHATYHTEDNQGRHLKDVEIWSVAGQVQYSSLFSAGLGPDHLLITHLYLEKKEIDFSHTFVTFLAKAKGVDSGKTETRLLDLEVPVEDGITLTLSSREAAPPAKATLDPTPAPSRQGRGGVPPGPKDLMVPLRPTPTHLGALHDSGTEIPP